VSPATIIVSSSPTGVPYGPPVFIGHGTPGSRLDRYAGLDDPEWVRRRRPRFIGVDRPGFGCSDPWPEANLLAP
jgi:pimeloyl-ACP methyl ester carboxylesterase